MKTATLPCPSGEAANKIWAVGVSADNRMPTKMRTEGGTIGGFRLR